MYWSTSNPTCSKCNTCIALSNVWYQRQWHWKSVEMVFLTALGLGRDWEMEVVHGGTIEHNGPICYLTIIIIIIMTIMTMTQICMNNECEKRWTNKSDHLWMCEWTQIADCGQTSGLWVEVNVSEAETSPEQAACRFPHLRTHLIIITDITSEHVRERERLAHKTLGRLLSAHSV